MLVLSKTLEQYLSAISIQITKTLKTEKFKVNFSGM